ncbi:peroxisomal targeting signal 2 receptor [Irineochytrium annulatum]|nr:peroxisomal targeting signal 2 receptor [Irineochytrium annulatum]
MAMFRFNTKGYAGYGVEFSPFFDSKLAVLTASNYGIAGNGRLHILNLDPLNPREPLTLERAYDTQDGLFDGAWSEHHENQFVGGCGDGTIKLWDLTLADWPVKSWGEHGREVFSVSWNMVRKDAFCSGSWDQTIKIWNPDLPKSVRTLHEHTHCVYTSVWSPQNPDILASASGDTTVKLWDLRSPSSTSTIRASTSEVLSLDWNKYDPSCIATGAVDHSVKVWDLRHTAREVMLLRGHEYAVRRVRWSPHSGCILASASYDMSMRVWDTSKGMRDNLVHVHDAHTEFVLGVDFNLFHEGRVATCAWDEGVCVMDLPVLMQGGMRKEIGAYIKVRGSEDVTDIGE